MFGHSCLKYFLKIINLILWSIWNIIEEVDGFDKLSCMTSERVHSALVPCSEMIYYVLNSCGSYFALCQKSWYILYSIRLGHFVCYVGWLSFVCYVVGITISAVVDNCFLCLTLLVNYSLWYYPFWPCFPFFSCSHSELISSFIHVFEMFTCGAYDLVIIRLSRINDCIKHRWNSYNRINFC